MKFNSNDFTSDLRSKINLEIDKTIQEIMIRLKLEKKYYGELNEGIQNFCEVGITNNPSIRLNTLLLTKIANYVLVNYQNKNFVIKDEVALINFMENLSVIIREPKQEKKGQAHIQIAGIENKCVYNFQFNIPKNTVSLIDYNLVMETSINNIIQKIFMLSYFELQSKKNTSNIINKI